MASLMWTLLLVCLAAPCVSGVGLGGDCSSTACTDTTNHVCDDTKLCKLKTAQTCTVANSDNCVAGSACDSTDLDCQCVGTTYVDDASTGKCKTDDSDKLLGTCPTAGCSTAKNLECVSSKCLCTQSPAGGYVPDGTTGNCKVAKEKVGRACTASSATTECGAAATTHLECTGNGNTECACKSGYTGSTGGACTEIGPLKVGKTCAPGDTSVTNSVCGDPATTFLECPSGATECACKSGYTGDKGGTCTKKCDSGAGGLVGSLVAVTLAAILPVIMRD